MPGIVDNMTDLIGRTPLVRLNRLAAGLPAEVVVKVESFNPGGSVKDRIALNMIRDAEARGEIDRESIIVEPSCGSTGIALAMVCAVRGYQLILTMPETVGKERITLFTAYGAEVILTPGNKGMRGAVLKAEELAARFPGAVLLRQFENPANSDVHRLTTAAEIWTDSGGRVDMLVAGVGTGGTLSGIGGALKAFKPGFRVVAVEPFDSPVLSGGAPGYHEIQGIGTGFIPGQLQREIIDEVVTVKSEEAFAVGRRLAREEGILAGISSGAALFAALKVAGRAENKGRLIVALLPDSGERYLTTPLFRPPAGVARVLTHTGRIRQRTAVRK